MSVNTILDEIDLDHFRVTIFGSSRIKESEPVYLQIYDLAKHIATRNFDIVTGGGPGIMEAANKGHKDGRKNNNSQSVGLNIKLPHEQQPNIHLDVYKEFDKFSSRLDTFMKLSNIIIVAPGGIGTLLEFLYTWQLIQVKHICNIPIILLSTIWDGLIDWIFNYPLKQGFLDEEDFNNLLLAKDNTEALWIIDQFHEAFLKGNDYCSDHFLKYCVNSRMDKL
jgi:uncharacterized protein (TIGR00730 family)